MRWIGEASSAADFRRGQACHQWRFQHARGQLHACAHQQTREGLSACSQSTMQGAHGDAQQPVQSRARPASTPCTAARWLPESDRAAAVAAKPVGRASCRTRSRRAQAARRHDQQSGRPAMPPDGWFQAKVAQQTPSTRGPNWYRSRCACLQVRQDQGASNPSTLRGAPDGHCQRPARSSCSGPCSSRAARHHHDPDAPNRDVSGSSSICG